MDFGSKRSKADEDVTAQVVAVTERMMHRRGLRQPVHLDTPLAEEGLGFDSMARLELLHAIEEELGVKIPDTYWGTKPVKNLRHLIKLAGK